ncbi:membrane dipeptidase [Texcoconibacillus texcoconensis]|uniref:Membrane dipeptidase n=1 Tax=Texcoconibacillus texcoconensis TaxID=1095777 RepID=A0A840QQR9_9BACI|nr:membrane dipeptidase [Texcoconibacillus texcoconensis]
MLPIIDLHCDALLKLWEDETRSFRDHPDIETNLIRLQTGGVRIQFFAIFIEPTVPSDQTFHVALSQIDRFYQDVLANNPEIKHIRAWNEINDLEEGEIGAVLTLEGAEAIGNDLMKLRMLYEQGVLSVGLTWNNANLCADGVGEPRGGGLTNLGYEVVNLNNQFHRLTDVSHLSEASFWNVIESADYPVATHSNARAVCEHRRNLYDDQLRALFEKGGFIGIVFNPPFINGQTTASIDEILKHIEHICTIGGENHLAFGSDFDGISYHVDQLEHAGMYDHFINELLKRYSEDRVRKFAHLNMLNRLPRG